MAAKRTHIMLRLFRCGETAWEREGRMHGLTDLPLSNAGRASTVADAEHLQGTRLATIHHPRDEAAAETAQILAEASKAKTREASELADPNLGLFEGLLEQQVAERHPKRYKQWLENPLALVPPEGEPLADARSRIFRAVAKLIRKSRADEVSIVLHPIAYTLLRGWLADRPVADMAAMLRDPERMERYAVATSFVEAMRAVGDQSAVGTGRE